MSSPGTETRLSGALAGTAARLALRQQNLGALLPVLLHDVNGSLNGLALSTELLSRLPAQAGRDGGDGGLTAANLLQRTRNELGRLKAALKSLEIRLLPGVAGIPAARAAPLATTLLEIQAILMPAVRRGQHEWRLEASAGQDLLVALRQDELFDVVAGLAIIAIDGAPTRSTLAVGAARAGEQAVVTIEHAGTTQAGIALEQHRELLRATVGYARGQVEWQQASGVSRARLLLPLAPRSP